MTTAKANASHSRTSTPCAIRLVFIRVIIFLDVTPTHSILKASRCAIVFAGPLPRSLQEGPPHAAVCGNF